LLTKVQSWGQSNENGTCARLGDAFLVRLLERHELAEDAHGYQIRITDSNDNSDAVNPVNRHACA